MAPVPKYPYYLELLSADFQSFFVLYTVELQNLSFLRIFMLITDRLGDKSLIYLLITFFSFKKGVQCEVKWLYLLLSGL